MVRVAGFADWEALADWEVAASLARERSLRVSAESEAAAQAQIEESIQTQLAEVQAAIDMRQCRLRSTPRRLCVRSRTL